MKLAYLSEESDFTRHDYEVTLRFVAKSATVLKVKSMVQESEKEYMTWRLNINRGLTKI